MNTTREIKDTGFNLREYYNKGDNRHRNTTTREIIDIGILQQGR